MISDRPFKLWEDEFKKCKDMFPDRVLIGGERTPGGEAAIQKDISGAKVLAQGLWNAGAGLFNKDKGEDE